jgi:hypothetical protein
MGMYHSADDPPRGRQHRAMSVYDDLDVREARIKGFWEELLRTPLESPKHRVLVEDIIEESAAYLAVVEADRRDRTLDTSG